MCLVVGNSAWSIPPITSAEMLPRCVTAAHRALSIDKQEATLRGVARQSRAEVFMGGVAASACDDGGPRQVTEHLCKEHCEAATALGKSGSLIATSFHVDANTHHRFPPISPFRQSWPRE
jgi:hypothetical protein